MGRRQNIKSRKFGTMSQQGGGVKKIQKCPNFNLGILKTEGGVSFFQKCPNFHLGILKTEVGGLYFSKMSQFQLFDSVFCNITFIRNVRNSKMSPFGQRGGGQHFSKMTEIQKCSKGQREGGVSPNWDIVPHFLDFLF